MKFTGFIEAAERYASGHIVLVFVDGVEIVRRLERQPDRFALHPAQPDFPTLELSDTDENWLIRGRVLAAITLLAPPWAPLSLAGSPRHTVLAHAHPDH